MSNRRSDRARELCRRLAADVAAVAPSGLGQWPPAWEVVEAPSKWFLELLADWERSGDPLLPNRIRHAYDAVVEAWSQAADRYERAQGEQATPGELART